MPHFRPAPLRDHPSMCLPPIRELGALLQPVDDSGFVAPVQELRHRTPVRRRHHKLPHRGFVLPRGAGPERAFRVVEQAPAQISPGPPPLPGRHQREEEESWQVTKRPNSKAGYRDQRHVLTTVPSSGLSGSARRQRTECLSSKHAVCVLLVKIGLQSPQSASLRISNATSYAANHWRSAAWPALGSGNHSREKGATATLSH